jgi:hypothetical protein
MLEHDITAYAAGLSARLAARSRHVVTFLGAGSSRSCGLPDVQTLQSKVSGQLIGSQKTAFEALAKNRNLEQVLSRIRRIAAVVDGDDSIDGLKADSARLLDIRICELIVQELGGDATDMAPVLKFGAWASRADYSRPVEIFTVNYDLLIECALEEWGTPYFDGFVGNLAGRFRSDLVEAPSDSTDGIPSHFVRLWKLHGSLNWAWQKRGVHSEVVRLGTSVGGGDLAAIYPSDAKYEESRRVPFIVLQDRLRRSLNEPETLALVSGYSWADDHLNELFFEAATRRPRSEIIAFCFDSIPAQLADHAALTPNLQVVAKTEAILGGVRAPWKSPDAALPEDIWANGEATLGNFACLASYLARATSSISDLTEQIAEIITRSTGFPIV